MSTTIRHPPPLNDPRTGVQKHYISPTPNARIADDNGLNDILGVTQILENHDIPCFCVGISALKFYGAARDRRVRTFTLPLPLTRIEIPPSSTYSIHVQITSANKSDRQEWEICVPTELAAKAHDVFRTPPYATTYIPISPVRHARVMSFLHTYRRYQIRDLPHVFVIVPSRDVHLDCRPSKIVRSLRGLPYPSLEDFFQSCLDRRDEVELTDLIDGTNVTDEWGEAHLDLNGCHDVEWAREMKRRTDEWDPRVEGKPPPIDYWPTRPSSKREFWQELVQTKMDRLDWSRPPEIFLTQYRIRNSSDPWTVMTNVA